MPIVLATIPLTAGHPDGSLVFNVVFVTVLASLIVQAGTVGLLVKRLGFAEDVSGAHAQIAVLDGLVADLIEVRLTARSPVVGTRLSDQRIARRRTRRFRRPRRPHICPRRRHGPHGRRRPSRQRSRQRLTRKHLSRGPLNQRSMRGPRRPRWPGRGARQKSAN